MLEQLQDPFLSIPLPLQHLCFIPVGFQPTGHGLGARGEEEHNGSSAGQRILLTPQSLKKELRR